jgi:lipopolysaccharide transport system ATP-binding protein
MNIISEPRQDELTQIDDDVILSVQGVSKKFCRSLKRSLIYGVQDITQEMFGLRGESNNTLRSGEFWALEDVSFELRRGEALGLVGKNGSGKSTLLRLIAGLIKPDVGKIIVKGRVAPLIALGAGFNPILTGRENIYVNMSILGLSKEEIDERFDEVVEFAEIGEAIDAPLQTYSSGMAARLGFASAIYTQPDILLIDEVLAVGDVKFRVKCVQKLYKLRKQGVSFILVSHNHDALITTCKTGVYLLNGISLLYKDIHSIIDQYESDLFIGSNKSTGLIKIESNKKQDLIVKSIRLKNQDNEISGQINSGKPAKISILLSVSEHIKNVWINVQIESGDIGQIIYISSIDDVNFFEFMPGNYQLDLSFPCLSLGAGNYTLRLLVRNKDGDYFDRIDSFCFTVEKEEKTSYSKVYQPRTWNAFQISEIE